MSRYLEIAERVRKAQRGQISPSVSEGMWVEFQSPLFGVCTGKVLSIGLECFVLTDHSVLKERATIPVQWVKRIIED